MRSGKPQARRPAQLARSDGVPPVKVKEKLRALMWDKVGVEKNAAGLRSALDDIEAIRLDVLPDMRIANRKAQSPITNGWTPSTS